MAGRLQRVFYSLSLPAIITIVSIYWLRKRRKVGQIASATPEIKSESILQSEIVPEQSPKTSTLEKSAPVEQIAEMQLKEETLNNKQDVHGETALDNKENGSIIVEVDLSKTIKSKLNLENDGTEEHIDKPELVKAKGLGSDQSLSEEENFPQSEKPSGIDNKAITEDALTEISNPKIKEAEQVNDDAQKDSNDTLTKETPESKAAGKSSDSASVQPICESVPKKDPNDIPCHKSSTTETSHATQVISPSTKVQTPVASRTRDTGKERRDETQIDSPSICAFSDIQSEGGLSTDSGKGGSDGFIESPISNHTAVDDNPFIVYQFELPSILCGKLIGKSGHFVNSIKQETNANIIVNNHPYSIEAKICSVEGSLFLISLVHLCLIIDLQLF